MRSDNNEVIDLCVDDDDDTVELDDGDVVFVDNPAELQSITGLPQKAFQAMAEEPNSGIDNPKKRGSVHGDSASLRSYPIEVLS
jgi:hypothetical protein